MLTRTLPVRKAATRLAALLAALWLAACDVSMTGGPTVDTGAPVPVALLVPRSAADGGAILSQSLENAARLAMADLQGAQIDLRVYDSGGQDGTSAAAAQQAVADGARIILGPVYASASNAAGNAVASSGVNVLSFSNNPGIAGGNVFILGTTFDSVAVAADDATPRARGAAASSSSAPRTWRRRRGATPSCAPSRAPAPGSPARPPSRCRSRASPRRRRPSPSQIQASGANAVFLTSGTAGALPYLADLLPANGVSPQTTQYIGLQRLDIPAGALSQPGLQGAWFALPDPAQSEAFRARYTNAFGAAPHPIAGLAYDGIAAIGALVAAGPVGRADRGRADPGRGLRRLGRHLPAAARRLERAGAGGGADPEQPGDRH